MLRISAATNNMALPMRKIRPGPSATTRNIMVTRIVGTAFRCLRSVRTKCTEYPLRLGITLRLIGPGLARDVLRRSHSFGADHRCLREFKRCSILRTFARTTNRVQPSGSLNTHSSVRTSQRRQVLIRSKLSGETSDGIDAGSRRGCHSIWLLRTIRIPKTGRLVGRRAIQGRIRVASRTILRHFHPIAEANNHDRKTHAAPTDERQTRRPIKPRFTDATVSIPAANRSCPNATTGFRRGMIGGSGRLTGKWGILFDLNSCSNKLLPLQTPTPNCRMRH